MLAFSISFHHADLVLGLLPTPSASTSVAKLVCIGEITVTVAPERLLGRVGQFAERSARESEVLGPGTRLRGGGVDGLQRGGLPISAPDYATVLPSAVASSLDATTNLLERLFVERVERWDFRRMGR